MRHTTARRPATRWPVYRDSLSKQLCRARVKRQRAALAMQRLELAINIERSRFAEADADVRRLWPLVPAAERGYFNDDLQVKGGVR